MAGLETGPVADTRAPKRGRNLAVAVPTALGLIGLLVASVLFSRWPFVVLVIVALGAALHELSAALAKVGLQVPWIPLAVGAAGTQVAAASGTSGVVVGVFLTLAAGLAWRVFEGDWHHPGRSPGTVSLDNGVPNAATDGQNEPGGSVAPGGPGRSVEPRGLVRDLYAIVFVTVYLPALAGLVTLIAFMEQGRWLILLMVAIPVASDTGGYFVGSYFGKHKLAAKVSPAKSWEGLAGSVALALVAGIGGMALMQRPWYFGAALGIAGALAATLGDLAESLLKRAIGIKDMGTLLPGHGGVLDRVDSILMTAPLTYAVIVLFGSEVFG
jgi:phosphatidate cytidylyltransferase